MIPCLLDYFLCFVLVVSGANTFFIIVVQFVLIDNSHDRLNFVQNFQTSQGYIFRILQRFAQNFAVLLISRCYF